MNDEKELYDVNVEATAISTILKHPEFLLSAEMLKPNHFHEVENGCILWCVQELYKRGIDNIDALNIINIANENKAVSNVLKKKGVNLTEFIDLSKYVARDTIEEFMVAVKQIVTLSYKRDLSKLLLGLNNSCYNSENTLEDLDKLINSGFTKLDNSYILRQDVSSFSDKVDDLWSEVLKERNNYGFGIPTIFPYLTEHGLVHEKGELMLVCAKRKEGKSMLLMNELIDKLNNNMSCVYFDSEMSDRLFMIRMLCNITGISQNDIKSGNYSKQEEKKIKDALNWLKSRNFQHLYFPVYNEQEIRSTLKIFKYKYGLDMMFYDYFKSNETDSSGNYNALGHMCDYLKSLAGEFDIPVLAAAQLNRGGEIADSFKLEMFSSCGLSWRHKTSTEIQEDGGLDAGNYYLHIDYARSAEPMGEDEYLSVSVDGSRMRIKQAEKQAIEKIPFNEDGE